MLTQQIKGDAVLVEPDVIDERIIIFPCHHMLCDTIIYKGGVMVAGWFYPRKEVFADLSIPNEVIQDIKNATKIRNEPQTENFYGCNWAEDSDDLMLFAIRYTQKFGLDDKMVDIIKTGLDYEV